MKEQEPEFEFTDETEWRLALQASQEALRARINRDLTQLNQLNELELKHKKLKQDPKLRVKFIKNKEGMLGLAAEKKPPMGFGKNEDTTRKK